MMADEKKKRGRPFKFKSAKEMKRKIDEYFESCFEEVWDEVRDDDGVVKWVPRLDRHGNIVKYQKEPFTISGLAVFLGTNRQTLLNYEETDEFFDTIKQAKAKIEAYTEKQLYNDKARNTTGIIFNLKNNYGWSDKQEVDTNIGNKDGKPFETKSDVNLKSLSAKELADLERILSKTAEPG